MGNGKHANSVRQQNAFDVVSNRRAVNYLAQCNVIIMHAPNYAEYSKQAPSSMQSLPPTRSGVFFTQQTANGIAQPFSPELRRIDTLCSNESLFCVHYVHPLRSKGGCLRCVCV